MQYIRRGNEVPFVKMHGCGNDYIFVEEFLEEPLVAREAIPALCNRHTGIGADGVIFIHLSDKADFEMEMYNSDGSRGRMCGNGIRLVAKYVSDRGYLRRNSIMIESMGKVYAVTLLESSTDDATMASVNMGKVRIPKGYEKVLVGNAYFYITEVDTGNPHAVIILDSFNDFDVAYWGALIENNERYPDRTNVEFVKVIGRDLAEVRVWERGSGETLACGSGSVASVAALRLHKLTGNHVRVRLLGGELIVDYNEENDEYILTGPAVEIYGGIIY